ncbi:MAG: LptF/LptG family permease [Elusimicrobia bacterium]|nr:LptF/LptG family permease [Elusimicrobiota bacterium]MDE2236850.1 LptF/LptG family permease [Elusimicrobiota bacterium]MDE2426875.1 LptF/LptG family permease [Elusimicrobiota bacterium]
MPILPRYLLRQFLPIFALSLGVFTGVLVMNHFVRLFNLAVMKGISPLWIAGCFARLLPFIAGLAVPMAFLVATLLTLGQLSESGEVTALRASGFSFGEMTWPFLAAAAALSVLLLYVNHKAAPEGFHSFRDDYLSAASRITRIDFQAGSFVTLGPWKLFAKKAEPETGRLSGVYLVRQGGSQRPLRVEAERGRLSLEAGRGAVLELEDGVLQLPNPDPSRLTSGSFERYALRVPLAAPIGRRALDIPEMDTATLRRRLADPTTSRQHRVEYAVEIAVRSAGALTPLVFFCIAAPLGMRLGRHSRGFGFAASLVILFGFYGLLALGIGVGRREAALASVAPWAADAAGLALGAVLTRRAMSR